MSRRASIIAALMLAALALSACGARDDAGDDARARIVEMVVHDDAGREIERSAYFGEPDAVQYKIAQVDARLMALRARKPGDGLTVVLQGGGVSRTYTLDASLRGTLFRLDQDIKSDGIY